MGDIDDLSLLLDEENEQGPRSHATPRELAVEQAFDSMEEARDGIKFLLQNRGIPFAVRYSCPLRFMVVCPKPNQPCDFVVSARYRKRTGQTHIIQCNLLHGCGVMLEANPSTTQGSWVCQTVQELIQDVPGANPGAVRNHVQRRSGNRISYSMAWRAASTVRERFNSNEELAFQLIRPFFQKINETMPGSTAVMHRTLDNCLLRTFVTLSPLMEALFNCKPVISFDACALKGKYKGVLMAATMMDGAGQILPLA